MTFRPIKLPNAEELKCPRCGKVVKIAGLADHTRTKHPEAEQS